MEMLEQMKQLEDELEESLNLIEQYEVNEKNIRNQIYYSNK